MQVLKELNGFYDVLENSWSGARDVLHEVMEQNREEEAMAIIEEVFMEGTPTETAVNDFVWFDLADMMNLYDDDEEEEEEE